MFGDLFGEDACDSSAEHSTSANTKKSVAKAINAPPMPRLSHGFCGIQNQGATCYLNSLIQTLAYTPEFRDALFKLTWEELGNLSDSENPLKKKKVRVIPLQLQRLIAKLLLLDIDAVKTDDLTESFGWRQNEEMYQQDVQELNRILFTAVEESLIGTTGENIIRDLYHGNIVYKIQCEACGNKSESKEDFLDLSVPMDGYAGIMDSFQSSYNLEEFLTGSNQYKCSKCNCLCNAKRISKLRHLPPILTLSLLRFNFDIEKMERYKNITRFEFPMELDMTAFCDQAASEVHTRYELYSVVIHRGSAHGGHYHAYIRDVDGLGHSKIVDPVLLSKQKFLKATGKYGVDTETTGWTSEYSTDTKTTKQRTDPKISPVQLVDGSVTYSPLELLQDILLKVENNMGLSFNSICSEVTSITGQSWNQKYKRKYGGITQFLRDHSEVFIFSTFKWVTLTPKQYRLLTQQYLHDSDINVPDEDPSPTTDQHSTPAVGSIQEPSKTFTSEWSQDQSPNQLPASVKDKDQTSNQLPNAAGNKKEAPELKENKPTNIKSGDEIAKTSETSTSECNSSSNSARSSAERCNDTKAEISAECQNAEPGVAWCSEEELKVYRRWYDFDDKKVQPITFSDILKQHGGKESAYMLFYRSVKLVRPAEAAGNPSFGIPDVLKAEVAIENNDLKTFREFHENLVNSVEVTLLFGKDFEYCDGGLHTAVTDKIEMNFYRTDTIAQLLFNIQDQHGRRLKAEVDEGSGSEGEGGLAINIAKELPSGLHLYQNIMEDLNSTLAAYGMERQCKLFIWNGIKIKGQTVPTGVEYEPILLAVSYRLGGGSLNQFSCGYAKNMTVAALKQSICERVGLSPDWALLKRVSDYNSAMMSLDDGCQGIGGLGNELLTDESKTLQDLKLNNCDQILCEDLCNLDNGEELGTVGGACATNKSVSKPKSQQRLSLIIENRCAEMNRDGAFPQTLIEVTDDMTVGELKAVVLTQVTVNDEVTRLRLDRQSSTTSFPPLHEDGNLSAVGITDDSCLILEHGSAPTTDQDSVTRAGLVGDDWHLRRTDWGGEPGEVLDDLEVKVKDCGLKHGDVLALQEGRVPPRGFMYLTLRMLPCLVEKTEEGGWTSVVKDLAGKLKDSLGFGADSSEAGGTGGDQSLGSITVSKSLTLQSLKQQIVTLPGLSQFSIPDPRFLRLRVMQGTRAGRVLRDHSLTLTKLKLLNGADIGVEILNEEEDLGPNEMLLMVQLRDESSGEYIPPSELRWEISQGASPSSLHKAVALSLGVEEKDLCLAKHRPDKYDWILLADYSGASKTTKPNQGKNKNKKKKGGGGKGGGGGEQKIDLKKSPYLLEDGDVIGVKVRQNVDDKPVDLVTAEEFMTSSDMEGRTRLEEEREAIKQRRLENRKALESAEGFSGPKRRQEQSIKIHVDDFR